MRLGQLVLAFIEILENQGRIDFNFGHAEGRKRARVSRQLFVVPRLYECDEPDVRAYGESIKPLLPL